MALQNTDVLLVNRGDKSAHVTVKQLKDNVLGGLSSDTGGFTWVTTPSQPNEISSTPVNGEYTLETLDGLQFNGGTNASKFAIDDYVIFINVPKGNGGTYQVTAVNEASDFIGLSHQASSSGGDIEVGDEVVVINLGSTFSTDDPDAFKMFVEEAVPTDGKTGDLWYKPSSEALSIYVNNEWVQVNQQGDAYNNGEYYVNVVNDLGIDNTGATDVSEAVTQALEDMFTSGVSMGTIYFPAGIYKLDSRVYLSKVGSTGRASWVIKGDGTSTKFYCGASNGGIYIETKFKDNYITVQDLAIHPRAQINGNGLRLQNGNTDNGELPSGGSNQQFGCQLINVVCVPDESKPTTTEGYKNTPFFKDPIALINYGRPRLSRVVVWSYAERSNYSFDNPTGIDYGYPFAPGQGTILDLTNCYSPWVDTCYFNGIANYGIYWNSDRGNTEGGTFTKIVINGAATGFYVNQDDGDGNIGRHPHVSLLDSHINSTLRGVYMNNVKYFAVEHVLFYARSDRPRERTHIDIELLNCISGTLRNGYSGGQYAEAISDRNKIPDNIQFNNSPGSQGYKDETTYTPHRIHVVLRGNDNQGGQGGVLKNRNIYVDDLNLNGYTTRCNPSDNSTLGQLSNGAYNSESKCDWQACYEVRGESADITIKIPAYPNAEGESGTFDSSQYPPEDKMVYVNKGRVKIIFDDYKEFLIDDNEGGTKAIQHYKTRLAADGKVLPAPQPIYTDIYQSQNNNGDVVLYGSFRCETVDQTPGNHTGQVMIQAAYKGKSRIALYLRDGCMYMPWGGEPEVISFNAPGDRSKPSIFYLTDGDPNGRLSDAGLGSLCLKPNDKMFFKTSYGWREVMLK